MFFATPFFIKKKRPKKRRDEKYLHIVKVCVLQREGGGAMHGSTRGIKSSRGKGFCTVEPDCSYPVASYPHSIAALQRELQSRRLLVFAHTAAAATTYCW